MTSQARRSQPRLRAAALWGGHPSDSPALRTPGGETYSYHHLQELTARLALTLRSWGLNERHTLALEVPLGAVGCIWMLSALQVCRVLPLDPRLREAEAHSLIREGAADAALLRTDTAEGAVLAASQMCLPTMRYESADPAGTRIERPLRDPGLDRGDWAILLATSGTEGTRKLVPLSWEELLAGSRATVLAYRLTADDRRLEVMPLHHIQGLAGSLLATLISGGTLVCPESFRPGDVPGMLGLEQVTWLSASPVMHRAILQAADGQLRAPSLRFVRSGSAPLDSRLRSDLQRFYGVPVIESYGMTEAHQIASSPADGSDPFLRPTGSEARLRPGTEFALEGARVGEMEIRGANVVHGDWDGARRRQVRQPDEWFPTGDLGSVRGGVIKVVGRRRELIERGAEKFSPAEVEDQLCQLDGIDQALCTIVHSEPETLLVAAVTGDPPPGLDLRAALLGRLSPAKVPDQILLLPSLPLTPRGKLSRPLLASAWSSARSEAMVTWTAGDGALGPAEDPLVSRMCALWASVLGLARVAPTAGLFGLAVDSLQLLSLVDAVDSASGRPITPEELFIHGDTPARLVEYLAQC